MSSTTWFAPLRHPSPAALEQWLEKQAADGRVLTDFGPASTVRMRFTESAPAQVRYTVERRAMPAPIDYFRFREENGWEHLGHAADVHIWSQHYTDERPAGFIGEDLDRRAGLVSIGLGLVAAFALVVAVALGLVAGLLTFDSASPSDIWAPAVAIGVVGAIAAIAAIAVAVSRRSAALRRDRTEVRHEADQPARV
ncbi:DUF2812 domain-containing protein [Gordonia shandongensis]|uniref:DUF2812 domain-containing protein n=1 Tax=Gordonia shandongensis TaxID=376351 RepID=UPI00040D6407|nr:DUF2812 domain-containing protein [Gordonia shandongensis]